MKAQVINEFGPPSVFKLIDVYQPSIKPGHVLIKVYASSVNQIDCKIRSGAVPAIAPDFPAILHGDFAGVIQEKSADVSQFEIGDEVYSCAGGLKNTNGALAEYMTVDARLIAKKPKKLSFLESAALPLVSITAWDALFIKGNLKENKTILVHGGVGGVGHIALQLAKWKGAKIFTTVLNDADIPLAKSLGADHVINAKNENVAEYKKRLTNDVGFDMVFDTVGGPNLENSFQAAAFNGVIITTAARTTQDLTPMHNKSLSLHAVFMLIPILYNIGRETHGKILHNLSLLVDEGKLRPLIDQNKFSLETISEAHTLLESGKARGKICIEIHKEK